MENPARTERYLATMAQRQQELRDELARILPTPAAFVWELGSGHGHFFTAYAKAHPKRLCIGVDMELDRVRRATKKRDRAGLPNLHFLRAEGRLFLQTLPADATFLDIFILFPDPWPKLRHRKHRILQPAFLDAIAVRAAPGCRLLFRTDHGDYFAEAAAVLEAHPAWTRVSESWPFEFETVFQRRAPSYHSLIARRKPSP